MPARAMTVPRTRPNQSSPFEGVRLYRLESANVGSRKCVDDVRDLGDLQHAADGREQREDAHRDLHVGRALGDVVLGTGEADVVVLDLAAGRVARGLGVVEVALPRARCASGQGSPKNVRKIIRNV